MLQLFCLSHCYAVGIVQNWFSCAIKRAQTETIRANHIKLIFGMEKTFRRLICYLRPRKNVSICQSVKMLGYSLC